VSGDGYRLVTSALDLSKVADEVARAEVLGLDIETCKDKSPRRGKLRILSLNTGQGDPWVLDLFQTQTLGPVVDALRDSQAIKVGQNLKYEQAWFLYLHGLELWPLFDTYRSSAILYNGKGYGHNLWDIQRRELGVEATGPDFSAPEHWEGVLAPEHYRYAAGDTIYMPLLRDKLKEKLGKHGLLKTALTEFGAILPETAVELAGFPLDPEAWLALAQKNAEEKGVRRKTLLHALPHPKSQVALPGFDPDFNLDSPAQILRSLALLGIEVPDTREMTLAMYASAHPVLQDFIAYRGVSKLLSSFGPEYLKHIDPETHRIHSEFFPFTAAGRYACSKPNLAQIPREKAFRACFKAPPRRRFVISDYSNIEMVIVAEISGDKILIQVFQTGGDAHYTTASILLDKQIEAVTKAERQQAKPVNFGFCVAEGQRVLTHVGLVPIEKVEDGHLVWDGVEWVSHDGLMFQGVREVMEYAGLEATPDHEVYTEEGIRMPLRDAASSLRRLAVGAVDGRPVMVKAVGSGVGGAVRLARTYDLRNAGPRHRFTVEGKVVSNCYGMQAPKLVLYALANYGVTFSLDQAKVFRQKYFEAYKGVRRWHAEVEANMATGIVRTLGGRLRYLDPHKDFNEYKNSPVQGTGADGLKIALRRVYFGLKKLIGGVPAPTLAVPVPLAMPVHHVHDEIVVEAQDDPDLLSAVEKVEQEEMREAMATLVRQVPVKVETSTGTSWAEK